MSLPRYFEYKDSGVAWLGEVPGHWEVKPIKAVATCNDVALEESTPEDYEIEYVEISNVESGCGITSTEIMPFGKAPSRARRRVSDGDVLVSTVRTYLRAIAPVNNPPSNLIASTGFAVVRPRMVVPHYLGYLFQSEYLISQVIARSVGVSYPAINASELMRLHGPIPSEEEQQMIAAFLDCETGKIDALIAEQRRLVGLLNEEIISLVLSSFREPETRDIRLSEVSTTISRPVIQKADESYTRIGLFNRGRGLFHKDASEMDEMGESDFFWIEEGDLIISGQFAWEGAVALAELEDTGCVVSHRYPVIRGKAGVVLTEYLLGLLCTKHGDFLLNENSRGAAGRNRPLNISSLMKEKIPVPSMGVQKRVARAVHARKALLKEIAKAIDLLQERRSALISAAVTGKIDVRDFAPTSQEGEEITMEAA